VCRGARFVGTGLGYADFTHADLSDADFTRAGLFRARFHRPIENGATVRGDRSLALGEDEALARAEAWQPRP
jgi:uncharacterized protein YjbI with pentapeptide repeats